MTPELDFLIHISRTALREQDHSAIGSLGDRGLDWPALLQLAAWYQVGGFLGLHLNDPESLVKTPDEIRDGAHRLSEENRVRFLFFVEPELERILRTLNREQIPVIALKGSALNRLVYRALGLRPIGDVDLLIEEGNLPRTRALFDDLGYTQEISTTSDSASIDNYHYCPRLLSPDGSVEIELHRHLVRKSSPLYFEVDQLWSQAREQEIAGHRAWILGPSDLISHLCLKFFVDRFLRQPSYAALRQLADIRETIQFFSGDLDWADFVDQARQRGHAGPIYCSLHTTQRLLGLDLDGHVLDQLRPPGVDDDQLKLFIERKVVDLVPWFFHELVESDDNTGWNLAKASLRRLLPEGKFLREKYWDQADSSGLGRLYGRHLTELAGTLRGVFDGGGRIREHLEVDHWMHRILTDSV